MGTKELSILFDEIIAIENLLRGRAMRLEIERKGFGYAAGKAKAVRAGGL